MPNGTYGGVRGKETKVGQKTLKKKINLFDFSSSRCFIRSFQWGSIPCLLQ